MHTLDARESAPEGARIKPVHQMRLSESEIHRRDTSCGWSTKGTSGPFQIHRFLTSNRRCTGLSDCTHCKSLEGCPPGQPMGLIITMSRAVLNQKIFYSPQKAKRLAHNIQVETCRYCRLHKLLTAGRVHAGRITRPTPENQVREGVSPARGIHGRCLSFWFMNSILPAPHAIALPILPE